MPSEAEAARAKFIELWPEVSPSIAMIEEVLSAASAVRSEPVAWEYERSYTEGSWTEPMLSHAKPSEQRPGDLRNLRPLYTSPVQTREDGIREAAKAIEHLRELLHKQYEALDISREHAAFCTAEGAVLALLSLPEPKGDKT